MNAGSLPPTPKLEEQDHDQLLSTVRRLLVEAEALSSRIAAVNEIGIAISRTFNLDEILRVVAKQAKWLLDFEHCSVSLRKVGVGDGWHLATLFGPAIACDGVRLADTPNIGRVLKTGQSLLVREGCPSLILRDYASQIIIPLVSEGTVIGTINFASRQSQAYRQEDLRIGYLLALQLSSAIRNAERVEALKRAEAELRRYATELEVRNHELDAYSHTIAHDLKTPLSGILLKADLLGRMHGKDLPPRALTSIDDIKASVMKMSEMIDQLLWLAQLRDVAGTVVKVDVAAVVETALTRVKHAADDRQITIEVIAPIPAAGGHAQWIEEVFANLISNAIKYMGSDNPAPRITIRGVPQGDAIRYEVQDTGVGITPEDQTRLFQMFTRLHTVKAEGLGLGLSIVQRIVTKLGGTIGVESARGVGSTFWFTLPAPESPT